MATYPNTLNNPRRDGFRLVIQNFNNEYQPDRGLTRTRSVTLGKVIIISGTITVKEYQIDDWENFYRFDLSQGLGWFSCDWLQCFGYTSSSHRVKFLTVSETSSGIDKRISFRAVVKAAADISDLDTDWQVSSDPPVVPPPRDERLNYGTGFIQMKRIYSKRIPKKINFKG